MRLQRWFAVTVVLCAVVVGIIAAPGARAATADDIRAELVKLQTQLQVLLQKVNTGLQAIVAPAGITLPVQATPAVPASSLSGYVTLDEVVGTPRVSCTVPAVKSGTSGPVVSLIQMSLHNGGYYPEGLVTGYYGKLTAAAVSRFQSSAGISVTGVVDGATAKALSELNSKMFADSCAPTPQFPAMCDYAAPPQGCRYEGADPVTGCGARLVCDNATPQCEHAAPPPHCHYEGEDVYPQCAARLVCADAQQPGITVTSPAAGETWTTGQKYEIRWQTNDPTMRPAAGRIALLLNAPRPTCLDSTPRCLIAERAPFVIAQNIIDSGSYTWTVPVSLPNEYRGSVQMIVQRADMSSLTGRSGTFTVSGAAAVSDTNPGMCVPWVNPNIPPINQPGPADLGISSLHVMYAPDQNLAGEGSFVTLADGRTVLVYAAFPEWAGDRQLMVVRQIKAAKGTGAQVKIANSKTASVYIASKIKLNVEHCSTLPIGYQSKLSEFAKQGGELRTVELARYQDVTIDSSKVSFSGADIGSVSDVTMTTGGSVYLITVYGKDENPLLNVVSDTRAADGKALIEKAQAVLQNARGDATKTVVGQSPHYEDPIYTFAGVRKGYTVFTSQLTVNGDAIAASGSAALLADLTAAVLRLGATIQRVR